MSGVPRPTTPTRRVSVQALATPSTHLRQGSTSGSPAYATTTRRHSLYGTEDRIIIDPGSHVWKVGFSGEGKPRHVGVVGQGPQAILWGSTQKYTTEERQEADRVLAQRLQDRLRSMFFEWVEVQATSSCGTDASFSMLLADPKSRKVIIVEHPLLPLGVKDLMAQILFENLNVCSVVRLSFNEL
jgi:actin-related protein 10